MHIAVHCYGCRHESLSASARNHVYALYHLLRNGGVNVQNVVLSRLNQAFFALPAFVVDSTCVRMGRRCLVSAATSQVQWVQIVYVVWLAD